jgi:hypothetical protein
MPRTVFAGFRERIGSVIPELDPIADVLALKMFAENGDGLPGAGEGASGSCIGFPLDFYRMCPEVAADFAGVAAYLTHSPRQWLRVRVNRGHLASLEHLSRYEAEIAIGARVTLEPSWLPRTLLADEDPDMWERFLLSPAAAPMLRAAVRELDGSELGATARLAWRALADTAFEVFDVDTASALTVLGFLGGVTDLCLRVLDMIIEICGRGNWQLLDIPVETWEGLAAIFRSALPGIGTRENRFVALLELAVAESIQDVEDDDGQAIRALTPFWVQALRIGAVSNVDWMLNAIRQSVSMVFLEIVGRERRSLLSLAGWAREIGDPSLVLPILELAGDGVWLRRFLGGHLAPEAVDDPTVARLLTHQEAMDLRWILGYMQEAKRNEAGDQATAT